MSAIRELFSDPLQVERVIQKVIDYSHANPEALQTEISEYVVTDHIQKEFGDVVEWIDRVSQTPGAETGVWVSGFYGSGKSSFTKYLGYAFDRSCQIEGRPFVDHLALRIEAKTVSQALKTLTRKMDAAVVMLDLASQTYGNEVVNVSDILYRKVLQWAGYCHSNLGLAELELMIEEDGRWDEFNALCKEEKKRDWSEIKNKTLIAKGFAKKALQRLYGDTVFELKDDGTIQSDDERAKNIIDIVRKKAARNM